MKRSVLFCICFCILMVISTGIKAQQLPNRSFENWKTGDKIPVDWNVLTALFTTSTSERIADPVGQGNYAVKLTSETKSILGKRQLLPGFLSLGEFNALGFLNSGGDITNPTSLANFFSKGFSIQGIPEKIEGFYKASGDNPTIFAFAKKNGQVITYANASGLSTPSSYTKFTLNFSDTTEVPDILYVAFSANPLVEKATLTLDSISIFYRLYTNGVKTDYFGDNQKISRTFDFADYNQKKYYDTVEYEYDSVNLSTLTAFPVGASVSVENGALSLKSGQNNSFNITITDPYNADRTETYSLNIYRKTPGVSKINVSSYIKGTTIKKSTKEANYDATDNSYHVYFLNEIDGVSVECELPSEKLAYEVITFVDSLVVGANNFVIRVSEKSDAGIYTDFNLVVNRRASDYIPSENANLQSLKFIVNGNEEIFSPVFHADSLRYTISREIPYLDSVASIEAQSADINAQVTGKGTVNLIKGLNIFIIAVTAENEMITKEYTIAINRNEGNNANLQSLKFIVNGNEEIFSPVFHADSLHYTISREIPYLDSVASIEARPADVNAQITGKGTVVLKKGSNQFTITVTAENGATTKEYIIAVKRNEGNNANLKSLVVKNNDTVLPFSTPEFLENYYIIAKPEIEIVDMMAIPEDENAIVTIYKEYFGGTRPAFPGFVSYKLVSNTNTLLNDTLLDGYIHYEFVVTAVDGSAQKEYILVISKDILAVEKPVINLQEIALYPNPTKDIVKISGLTGSAKVEIYDTKGNLLGKEIISEKRELNLYKYSKGTYILKIQTKENLFLKTVILK